MFSYPSQDTPHHTNFHRFSSLPMELRVKIWHQALCQQRLIPLRLRNRIHMDGLLARYGGERTPDRESEGYAVVADSYRIVSKLYRVSRDARFAAMSFYNVPVPCWVCKTLEIDGPMIPFTVRFNLEYDILWISTDTGQIPEFFHDLKTVHDPQKVGLLNLAVDKEDLRDWGGFIHIEVDQLSDPLRASFTETLSQLREVFFLHLQFGGRHVLGDRSGAMDSDYEVNLSLPIKTGSPSFARLERDPRPIGTGLKRLFLHHDPRTLLHTWGKYFFDQFGGSIVPQADYSIVVGFHPSVFQILDSQRARQWLAHEQSAWLSDIEDHQKLFNGQRNYYNTIVDSAFGFWLFSPEAFGPLPCHPQDEFIAEGAKFWDVSDFWPELCVPDLPEAYNSHL